MNEPMTSNSSPSSKKSIFDAHPKTTFWLGIITAVAILGLAGTVVFGLMYFKGGNTDSKNTGNTNTGNEQNIVLAEVTDSDHIRGPKDAPVTIIEYSDLECPFCKQFHPTINQLLKEFPTQVRWVFRHFPIVQLHSKAPKEHEASECAAEQGKFWEFLDRVFEITPANDGLDPAELPKIAKAAGVADIPKFEECLSSAKYESKVNEGIQSGLDAGVQGTPASFINGEPVYGAVPYPQLKAGVERLLK